MQPSASETAGLLNAAATAGAKLTLVPAAGEGPSFEDVVVDQVMEAIPAGAERAVIASIDLLLLRAFAGLKRAGLRTILLSRPIDTPVFLSLTADDLIDMTELSYVAEGLISPGQAAKVTRAISEQFARASHDIFIIDRYVRVGTIRLLAWVPPVVAITVIGTRMDADVRRETARLREHGRNIRLVEVPDQDISHDSGSELTVNGGIPARP